MPESQLDEASALLADHFPPAVVDEYGKVVEPGFGTSEASLGKVRIQHLMPEPSLLDDNRMSSNEMADVRHRMVDSYARFLCSLGWHARKTLEHSSYPRLVVFKEDGEPCTGRVCAGSWCSHETAADELTALTEDLGLYPDRNA